MTNTILCDTDFFVAFLLEEDSSHDTALELIYKYQNNNFVYLSVTKYELMTVLSRKVPQIKAIEALEKFEDLFTQFLTVDSQLEADVIHFYKKASNKNQSFFDIACLLTAQKHGYKIASFDRFYPKELLI